MKPLKVRGLSKDMSKEIKTDVRLTDGGIDANVSWEILKKIWIWTKKTVIVAVLSGGGFHVYETGKELEDIKARLDRCEQNEQRNMKIMKDSNQAVHDAIHDSNNMLEQSKKLMQDISKALRPKDTYPSNKELIMPGGPRTGSFDGPPNGPYPKDQVKPLKERR